MVTGRVKSRQQLRQEQRKERKFQASKTKAEAQSATQIKRLLKGVLSVEKLNEIARRVGFVTRQRKLPPFAIVAILLMGCAGGSESIASLEIMCAFLNKWFDILIKPQSLQSKLNRRETSDFIKEITTTVMMHEANKVVAKLLTRQDASSLGLFKRILLQDSTVISLPETVARIFKGCGGSASKAAVKCDIIFDQCNHLIVRLKCIAGRIPDAALSGDIISYLKEGDLVIRDLGYFNLPNLSVMIIKNVRFITRLSKSVHIYLNKNDDEPLDIIDYLKKLGIEKKSVDIDVYVGKVDRVRLRLIGVKVPPEVVEARRQHYKLARGRSTEPSESLQEWNGYTLMATNIPKEQLSLTSIIKIYKIRWQIELFFKNMKSYLHVDELTGTNKYRILCLIYTKLALTWIASVLYAFAQAMAGQTREISQFKFTRWLHAVAGWREVFATADFSELLKAFDRDKYLLCKQSKKRE